MIAMIAQGSHERHVVREVAESKSLRKNTFHFRPPICLAWGVARPSSTAGVLSPRALSDRRGLD